MLFNSFEFLVFLPAAFVLYWFVFSKNLKMQNLVIVCLSYLFYGWWDWRFLGLILFSTVVDYTVGLLLGKTKVAKIRKWLLWTSISINIGFLAVFKSFNFFVENLEVLLNVIGFELDWVTLNIVLPVGISFYTSKH